MATAAQTRANRLNAQKSTGPRTPEGKAVVAQNAVQHGLLAQAAVLQGEDWEEFTEFRENLVEELAPEGTLEGMLAERIVSLSWRLQRAARLQNEAYESLYLQEATSGYGRRRREEMAQGRPDGPQTNADDLIGGRVLAEDFGGAKVLERMLLYERRIEHSLYRTMGELQKLRRRRGSEAPTAGATPERGTGVSSVKSEASRERSVLPTSHLTLPTFEETPCSVTTNAVVVSMEMPANLANNSESVGGRKPMEAVGREPEGDGAKQSQFGADQIGANLGRKEGLRQEQHTAPAEEQSQNEDDFVLGVRPFGPGERVEATSHSPA